MKYKVLTLLLVCIVCITVVVISGCTSLPAGLSKSTAPQEVVSGGGGGGGGSPYASDTNLAYSGVVPTAVPTIATPSGGLPGQGVDTKIIKTAQVNLEVKNVTDAVEIIKEIGTGRGDTYRPRTSERITMVRPPELLSSGSLRISSTPHSPG